MGVRGSAMFYRIGPNCLGHCDATNSGRPATFAVEPLVGYREIVSVYAGLPARSTGSVVDEHRSADSTPATAGVVANSHPPRNWNLLATVSVASRKILQPLLRAVDTRQQVEDMSVIDDLEYVHTYDCIHADVKVSMLFFGFDKDNENKVYLVDLAVPCRYKQNGQYKECKEDLCKAHYGTIESRVATPRLVPTLEGLTWNSWDTTCSGGSVADCP
ncbi:hypothetical protein HPB50_029573 [Hyalomma asiaticum]|nr:hypothetical protein HPB50_029573 [Hyalomma asiaticum]